jgi:hypothetical protein
MGVPFLKEPTSENCQVAIALCLRSQIFPHFLNIFDKREEDLCHDQEPIPYVDAV